MLVREPRKEMTIYLKSGNVVTLPIEDDGEVTWRQADVIMSLNVQGIANPVVGFGFNLEDIEAFIVKQV